MALVILRLALVERVGQQLQVRVHQLELLEHTIARHSNQVIVCGAEAALVDHRVGRGGSLYRRHKLCLLPCPDRQAPVRRAALCHEQLGVWREGQRHKLLRMRVGRGQQTAALKRVQIKYSDDTLVRLLRHGHKLLVGGHGNRCDFFRLVGARQEALNALLQVENACVVPCRVQHRLLVHIGHRLADIPLDSKKVPVEQRRHRHAGDKASPQDSPPRGGPCCSTAAPMLLPEILVSSLEHVASISTPLLSRRCRIGLETN